MPAFPRSHLSVQVMHRDLKCANLLIGVDGRLKVNLWQSCHAISRQSPQACIASVLLQVVEVHT